MKEIMNLLDTIAMEWGMEYAGTVKAFTMVERGATIDELKAYKQEIESEMMEEDE